MPPLGDEKEVIEGTAILNSRQTIDQTSSINSSNKSRNNSYKLKSEGRGILYLLFQYNKITKILYNKLIKLL